MRSLLAALVAFPPLVCPPPMTAAAVALAIAVPGVAAAVVRGAGSGEDVEDAVAQRLAMSRSLAGSDIFVRAEDGRVHLSGTVSGEDDRTRAVEIARGTSGVATVEQSLAVDPRLGPHGADTDERIVEHLARTLADDVFPAADVTSLSKFSWQLRGPTWSFYVAVDGGGAMLAGTVPDRRALRRAIEEAQTVPGVRGVDARGLHVPPGPGARAAEERWT